MEQRTALADPIGQQRTIKVQAAAGIDGALPVQGQMVAELPDQDVGQQRRPGDSLRNGARRCLGLGNVVAGRTGEFGADMPDDLEARRDVLQHFGNILAQVLEASAALRAASALRGVIDRLAGQGFGEGLALAGAWLSRCRIRRGERGARTQRMGFKGQPEVELARRGPVFGTLAEMQAPVFGHQKLQVLDLYRLLGHLLAQRLDFARGLGGSWEGRCRHAGSLRESGAGEQPPGRPLQAALSGRQVRAGWRQSMPSSSMESCALER